MAGERKSPDDGSAFMLLLYFSILLFIGANVYGIFDNLADTYYVTSVGTSVVVLLGLLYGISNRMKWAWFVGIVFLSLIILNTVMLGLHLTLLFPVMIVVLLILNKTQFTE